MNVRDAIKLVENDGWGGWWYNPSEHDNGEWQVSG